MAESGTQLLDRAIAILRLISSNNRDGMKLQQIGRDMGLTSSTTHRIVLALEREHLIERDTETGAFRLGAELVLLGSIASPRFNIRDATAPVVAKLALDVGDVVLLSIRRGWCSVCISIEEGNYPIRARLVQPGDSHPLGVTSGGMAILAGLPDAEIEESLAINAVDLRRLYATLSDDFVRQEVIKTRARGYAVNPGRLFPRSHAIAVPLIGADDRCIGAIAVGAVDFRLEPQRHPEVLALLRRAAKDINQRLFRSVPSGGDRPGYP